MDTYLIESCALPKCLKSLESVNYKDLDPEANRNRRHMEAIYLHYPEAEIKGRGWTLSEGALKTVPTDADATGLMILGEQFGYTESVSGTWSYSNWRKCPDDDAWVYHHSGTLEARLVVRSTGWPVSAQSTMVSVGSMQPGQRLTAVFDGVTPDLNEYYFEPIEGCRLLPPRPFALTDTPRWKAYLARREEEIRLQREEQIAKLNARFDRYLYVRPQPRPWFLRQLSIPEPVRRFFGLRPIPTPAEPSAPPIPAPAPEPPPQEPEPEPPVTGHPCRLYVTMECHE